MADGYQVVEYKLRTLLLTHRLIDGVGLKSLLLSSLHQGLRRGTVIKIKAVG